MFNKNNNAGKTSNLIKSTPKEIALSATCKAKSKNRLIQRSKIKQISTYYEIIHSYTLNCACTAAITENHYTVEKTQHAVNDFLKTTANQQFTLIKSTKEIRIMSLCENMLINNGYLVNYQMLCSTIDEFQQIAPLDDSEISLLPDILRLLCINILFSLYAQAVSVISDSQNADMYYKKICESISDTKTAALIDQAVSILSCTGITRLYTLFCENDDFANIELIKKSIKIHGSDIFDEAAKDRKLQYRISDLTACSVNTIRFADSLNIEHLLERFSMLCSTLSCDDIYTKSESSTKRSCEFSCEQIAAKFSISPVAVANAAISMEKSACYYLLSEEGKKEIYQHFGKKYSQPSICNKLFIFILSNIVIITILSALCFSQGILAIILSIFPALIISNTIIIKLYSLLIKPRVIPRLDYKKNVLPSTVIAVSVLLTDEKTLNSVISKIETHYLSSKIDNCYFAILSDFKDSKQQEANSDESSLLKLASQKLSNLNKKYSTGIDLFYLFHRKREFNNADKLFMGHERKRGAIMTFLNYISACDEKKNKIKEKYSIISGEIPKCSYAVVLDSDTIMPPDTLGQMIAAMSHPLNRPKVINGKIESGYGILVPRIENLSDSSTEFIRTQSGFCGVVPYFTPVASFYNDVFDSCIFGGKGIIDIGTFLECIVGRITDNTVLSHDMIESSFVKSGYLSDIVLYDGEPRTLLSWWKRQHRWIRGDWQLIPYLFAKQNTKKHIDGLTRLKILDNLRRSLSPISVFILLCTAPFFGNGFYLFLGIASIFIDAIIDTFHAIIRLINGNFISYRELILSWQKGLLNIMSLPYAAIKSLDAIIRTLFRLIFSHRKMLEWQTAAQSEKKTAGGTFAYYPKMIITVLLGIFWLLLPLVNINGSIILGILFLYSPFALRQMDENYPEYELPDYIKEYYSVLASDIWQFFSQEASKQYNYIPPDNVQILPPMKGVYNTSPTNIGMSIVSACCAYDLELISKDELIERLTVSLDYIDSLEKWNGHLYNWYDIKTKKRLEPAYVSTVDSGNLCACMLYAGQILNELDINETKELSERYRDIATAMNFTELYDKTKNLFYIGYDVSRCCLTNSWYDLLASEARLTYYVACALGQISQKSWYSLSRTLVKCSDSRALVSWSGTMFEYLMPVIFTSNIKDTLFDETCKAVIDEHIRSSRKRGIPWGISESGYYAFDRNSYYQYKAFGEIATGLSPMYEDEKVVAPYASILAAMIYPEKAYENLIIEENLGGRGKYGFYEALDFTAARKPADKRCEIVSSFMAHHQGMSLCSLCNVLQNNIIQKRFESIPEIKTVLIFNSEKLPDSSVVLKKYERSILNDDDIRPDYNDKPQIFSSSGRYPRGIYLTNGSFSAFLTDSGLSYLKTDNIYISRFRRDLSRGRSGLSMYVNCDEKVYPVLTCDDKCDNCGISYSYELHKATMNVTTPVFSLESESIAAWKSNSLIVKISIANHSDTEKLFDLGAFCEISLASYEEDIAHPAFVRLSVDAELYDNTLIFRRRGTKNRKDIFCYAAFETPAKYNTNGLIIPGRHKSYVEAMKKPLNDDLHIKSPVEPYLCARTSIYLASGESKELKFVIGTADSLENAISDASTCISDEFTRQSSLSFAMEASALHFMGINSGKAKLFNRIGSFITSGCIKKPICTQLSTLTEESLYRFSISCKKAIVLVEIKSPTQFRLLKTLLKLLRYMAYKNDPFDLVIIGRYDMSYRCDIKSYINFVASEFSHCYPSNVAEYIHIIDGFDINEEEYKLLFESANVIIDANRSLDKQFTDEPSRKLKKLNTSIKKNESEKSDFGHFNDYGEYEFSLTSYDDTPLPWSNIIINPKNPDFGTIVTENGGGYTWKGNSQNGRITPWYNDALNDTQGEMLFISDTNGDIRSIFHSRIQGNAAVKITYGFGYSKYENPDAFCNCVCTIFTDTEAPQKIYIIELSNNERQDKTLTLNYLVDLNKSAGNTAFFKDGIAYAKFTSDKDLFYCTIKNADRLTFSADREGIFCEEKIESNYNSFINLECTVSLKMFETRRLIVVMGKSSEEHIHSYVNLINTQSAYDKLHKIKAEWDNKLSLINVNTPDTDFNNVVNKRLLYQVYASRLMGRAGFYQSGGAFGFRDQLQDVLSLLYTDSEKTKGQILLSASMQYEAGDVMHWWHSPSTGVRTKITDDRLFLAFVTCEYAFVTGDYNIFDIRVPFLENMDIPDNCDDIYYKAKHSKTDSTVYEHCLRSLFSLDNFGINGLPLMGKSDWNDGMDNIYGESIFLAFFMIKVCDMLQKVAVVRNDRTTLSKIAELKKKLQSGIDSSAWDGDRFLRAYYPDGYPLGSKTNKECVIDLLTQSFAVISDYTRNTEKCEKALVTVKNLLVDEKNEIIKLLTPAFTNSDSLHNAGYIESYIEGVRENGGQYTHAAAWYIIALCIAGYDEEAVKIFSMLNPVSKNIDKYMAEPFAVAGDVYSCKGSEGRGGWSWYTGSAAWLYIVAIKYILGIEKEGNILRILPHNKWDHYCIKYKFKSSTYIINIFNEDRNNILLDSRPVKDIILCDDGKTHNVIVGKNS